MSVVHPRPQGGVGALQQRAEGHLRARGEVPHGAQVAGDMLREAHDLLGVPAELAESAGQQQHLLEVGALVGIHALVDGAPRKGQGVVLVVCLAVAQDGIPRQLHAIRRLPKGGRRVLSLDALAIAVDETAVVSARLPRMDRISLAVLPHIAVIDVRDLQVGREALQHFVHLLSLNRGEVCIHLHRHQALEHLACVVLAPQEPRGVGALELVVQHQRVVVLAHARHGPPERLQSHGRPNAGFLPLLRAVAGPVANPSGHVPVLREVLKLVHILDAQVVDEVPQLSRLTRRLAVEILR
mmetsp:Transcript_126255/g.299774  ORF Transcript_126255/g.299774 Transcript_126255/m.299774 type:complete len:297 (-) Transcript_126255:90-980(-)